MTISTSNLTTQEYKCSHFAGNRTTNNQVIQKYKEIFGQTPVFNSVKPGEKSGFKNWDNPDTLKTVHEIDFLLNRNRNIAIRLGVETDRGYTVVFDKESYGTVPDSVINTIENHAVMGWESQSGGYNSLLTVTQDAYDYLNQYKTKVTFDGDKHDLEVLTSGYALVPPSRVGNNQYDDLQIYPDTPTVEIDSVVDILGSIPIDEKEDREKGNSRTNGSSSDTCVEHSSLPSDFEPTTYFKNNIPGNDSFHERIETMLEVPEINRLWYGDYQDRSQNELKLRSYVAWYFNGDKKIVQYIFESILPQFRDEPLKYSQNKNHAKDVLEFEKYVSRPYYTTWISFNLWEQLSREILKHESATVNELHGKLIRTDEVKEYEKDTIHNALQIFEKKDIINRISNTEYENKRIDQEYVERVNELNKEYNPTKYVDYE